MLLPSLAIAVLPLLFPADSADVTRRGFDDPIDALSVEFRRPDAVAEVRARGADGRWTAWERLEVEDEQDPDTLESNLVMFADDAVAIELRGEIAELHPVRVSDAPASYLVAGPDPGTPKILGRSQWGANDDLLYTDRTPSNGDNADAGDNGDATPASQRERTCLDAQRDHPDEFKTVKRTATVGGKTLRWTRTYSKDIDLLVVHHTAVKVSGDDRSGPERVRALYQYHAENRGWGDIGYHYLVDEDGQIYEGKSGGDYVVAGHAYCNNVNTIGIALLGNFEVEKPSQEQMQALQWLLDELADRYDIDVDDNATFHGQTFSSPIVGHGDLLATECPGWYVRQTLHQVRDHVEDGELDGRISFPKKPSSKSSSSRAPSTVRSSRGASSPRYVSSRAAFREGVSVLGSDTLAGRPGGEVAFSVRYAAGSNGATAGTRIAEVKRSDQAIDVWQLIAGTYEPVRGHIVAESSIPRNSTTAIQLKVGLPRARGTYELQVGDVVYSFETSGRVTAPGASAASMRMTRSSSSRRVLRPRPSRPATASSRSSRRTTANDRGPTIRIRLESRDAGLRSCDDADLSALKSLYRGTLRCVTVDGRPAIVNTVAMEDYLLGLSEEPDTEPYEKQRAFAIAARTYAAHYMGDDERKFPGKPYDGSDSPAIFQKYTGRAFEKNNPRWLDAVEDTAHLVLTKDDEIIRPPYFSSDDGRTKSPGEIGWGNFPFAEIFASKPDPWCEGMENRGHGVGMSGCGAEGQANEGKTGENILRYYYPGTTLKTLSSVLD